MFVFKPRRSSVKAPDLPRFTHALSCIKHSDPYSPNFASQFLSFVSKEELDKYWLECKSLFPEATEAEALGILVSGAGPSSESAAWLVRAALDSADESVRRSAKLLLPALARVVTDQVLRVILGLRKEAPDGVKLPGLPAAVSFRYRLAAIDRGDRLSVSGEATYLALLAAAKSGWSDDAEDFFSEFLCRLVKSGKTVSSIPGSAFKPDHFQKLPPVAVRFLKQKAEEQGWEPTRTFFLIERLLPDIADFGIALAARDFGTASQVAERLVAKGLEPGKTASIASLGDFSIPSVSLRLKDVLVPPDRSFVEKFDASKGKSWIPLPSHARQMLSFLVPDIEVPAWWSLSPRELARNYLDSPLKFGMELQEPHRLRIALALLGKAEGSWENIPWNICLELRFSQKHLMQSLESRKRKGSVLKPRNLKGFPPSPCVKKISGKLAPYLLTGKIPWQDFELLVKKSAFCKWLSLEASRDVSRYILSVSGDKEIKDAADYSLARFLPIGKVPADAAKRCFSGEPAVNYKALKGQASPESQSVRIIRDGWAYSGFLQTALSFGYGPFYEKIARITAQAIAPYRKGAAACLELLSLIGAEAAGPLQYVIAKTSRREGKPGARIDDLYHDWKLPKKSGGNRIISAPDPRLKIVQRLIYEKVLLPLGAHDAAHGFAEGRSIVTNASLHTGKPVVVTADVSKCFPSVSWKLVLWALKRDLGGTLLPSTISLIVDICTAKGGLPTGAPTSPALLNRVLFKTDQILTAAAEKRGCTYTRYADDLCFSGDHGAVEMLGIARSTFASIGLKLDEKKTNIFRKGRRQCCTGLVVNTQVSVARRIRRRLRAEVRSYELGREILWRGTPDSEQALEGRICFLMSVNPKEGGELHERFKAAKRKRWGVA